MQRAVRASDEEALRLALAFFRIHDPQLRRRIIALAESLAGQARPKLFSSPPPRPVPRPRPGVAGLLLDNVGPKRR